jgi:hypothetical protein
LWNNFAQMMKSSDEDSSLNTPTARRAGNITRRRDGHLEA